MTHEKKVGLIANLFIYLLAFIVGFVPYFFIIKNKEYALEATFIFTMVATFVVLLFALIYKNTSIYDPYWSVAPFVMSMLHMFFVSGPTINAIIINVIIFWYSFRLTRNWVITYKGLDAKYEDWRYADFRKTLPGWKFQFVNVFGLVYVPTLVVYASLVPVLLLMNNPNFLPLTLIGFAIMVAGPILEIISDYQVHKFIKDTNDHTLVCDYGLWNYSRHPNYFGELSFWFGMMVAFFLSFPSEWYAGFGFILMVVLFLAASIPLMEKHNISRRPAYKEYQKKTSVLFILPRKK